MRGATYILVEMADDFLESFSVDWRKLLNERLELYQLFLMLCFCES